MDSPFQIPVLKSNLQSVIETADVNAMEREVYEHNRMSIVQVTAISQDGHDFGGSGVLVKDHDGVAIVTNTHVPANCRSITFTNAAGESFAARLDKIDDQDDLATLKPDGVTIDPSRAVDIGDPSKLTPGQMLFAMGHPRRYGQPVISEGPLVAQGSFAGVAPEHAGLFTKLGAQMYGPDPKYTADVKAFVNSPRLDALVPTDHGSSGGALFDKNSKLVGITEQMKDGHPEEALAISSDRVKAMLADPMYKFQADYHRQILAQQSPATAVATSFGLAALAAPVSRKFAAPAIGLYYGGQALSDMRMLSQDNLYRGKAYYWEKLAADGGTFAAGMLSVVPKLRLVGAAVVGARLAYDLVTQFTDSTPVMDGVRRTDGSKGDPLWWTISHH